MKIFEQDQEYDNCWSSFLDFDSFFGPPSLFVDINQADSFVYHDQYLGGYHYDDRNYSYIGDNELNQEQTLTEFSQLGVGEAVEFSPGEDQICTPDAPSHGTTGPYTNYWLAHEVCEQAVDDNEPSTSSSSPGEILHDCEAFSQYLELTNDSAIDGKLGKRLNQMVPVPHVPRTNGEIPSIDQATSDHQRLLDRLELYDLDERKVQGDGNCQSCFAGTRQQVVNQLKSNPEYYDGYITMEYGEYLEKMSKCGEWGDHVTLQAAADSYGVKIFVITSFKDTCYIEILPKIEKSERVIFLSFWAEVHYNSIYPQEESPPCVVSKKKKRCWSLRQKH